MIKKLGHATLLGVFCLSTLGFASLLVVSGLVDEEAFKLTTLNQAAGTQKTRMRITGGEDPARVVFENVDVGIGVTSPTEDLEIAGALKIGTADGTADGTIRWTGSDFEGRRGGGWRSFASIYGPSAKMWFLEDFERNELRGSPFYNSGTHKKTEEGGTYSIAPSNALGWHEVGDGDEGPWDPAKNPIVMVRAKKTANGSSSSNHARLGLKNKWAGTPESMIGFSRKGGSGLNWLGECFKDGTGTSLDLGVAADGTYRVLKAVVTGTTQVEFFVDGVSKGTITTNIPTDRMTVTLRTSSGTPPSIEIDWVYVEQDQ